jgi:hypothetical protein
MGAKHFPAEAKPAIDRANMHEFQKHTVRVTMNKSLQGTMGGVPDRVGEFIRTYK